MINLLEDRNSVHTWEFVGTKRANEDFSFSKCRRQQKTVHRWISSASILLCHTLAEHFNYNFKANKDTNNVDMTPECRLLCLLLFHMYSCMMQCNTTLKSERKVVNVLCNSH